MTSSEPQPAVDAVERQLASDMIRRAVPLFPVLVAAAWLVWGVDGALSAAFAIALVILNFLVAATLVARSAEKGPVALMAAAFGGFIVRLTVLTVAVLAVKDQSWVDLVPLGLTLVVTHLGLLIWEARHVSLSLAFPAVKPDSARP